MDLTHLNIITMNQSQRFQQARPAARPQSHGRVKEQREEDYRGTEADEALWAQAGAAARRIIRRFDIPDTAENWRAIRQEVADALLPLA